jgi:hypothetical protein
MSSGFGFFIEDLKMGMILSIFAGFTASGLAMYLLLRGPCSRAVAAAAAILYMGAPYRIVDVYLMSAFAEHQAFLWYPLIAYFGLRVRPGSIGAVAGLMAAYAGLILTHAPSTLLFSLFLGMFLLFLLVVERDGRRLALRVLALAGGAALGAMYLLPVLAELQYVNADIALFKEAYDYQSFFLFARSHSRSSQMLALVDMWGLLAVGIGLTALAASEARGGAWPRLAAVFFCSATCLFFFFMLKPSQFVWELLPVLKRVQFAYRMSAVMTFGACVCLGLMAWPRLGRAVPLRRGAAVLAVLLSLGALGQSGGTLWTYHREYSDEQRRPAREVRFRAEMSFDEVREALAPLENFAYMEVFMPVERWLADTLEYRPIWSVTRQGFGIMPEDNVEQASCMQGQGKVTVTSWGPQNRRLLVEAVTPCRVQVKTFYYPGWRVTVDGRAVDLQPLQSTGLMAFNVPAGRHEVQLWFAGSSWVAAGKAVSGAALVLLVSGLVYEVARRRRRDSSPV